MNQILRRRRELMAAQNSGLPSAYQQVEYIEAASAGPYIDTLISMAENDEIRCGIQQLNAGSNTCVYGQSAPSIQVIQYSNATLYVNFARISAIPITGSIRDQIYNIIHNKNNIIVNDLIWGTFSGDLRTFTAQHMFIFARPKENNPNVPERLTTGRCSYFKILRNGELICNLIPCYRKLDAVIGMYNTVSQMFFTNAGTGSFTKGADV